MADRVTGCVVCHRAVYEQHVDKDGRCIFCRPAEQEQEEQDAKKPLRQP